MHNSLRIHYNFKEFQKTYLIYFIKGMLDKLKVNKYFLIYYKIKI